MQKSRKHVMVILAAIAGFVLPLAVHADNAAVKKEIQASYDQIAAAMKRKDVKSITKLGADGFTSKSGKQTMNAEQSEKMLTQMLATMKSIDNVKIRILHLSVKGNKASVQTDTSMAATVPGKDGKTHKLVVTGKSNDTWIKTPKGWRTLVVEDAPGAKVTMDGKPMPAQGAPGGPGDTH